MSAYLDELGLCFVEVVSVPRVERQCRHYFSLWIAKRFARRLSLRLLALHVIMAYAGRLLQCSWVFYCPDVALVHHVDVDHVLLED